jgi:hypothetical protein
MNARIRISGLVLGIGLLSAGWASSAPAQDVVTGRVFMLAADGTLAHQYGTFEMSDVHVRVWYGGGGYAFSVDATAPVNAAGTGFRYTMYETTFNGGGTVFGRTVGGGDFTFMGLATASGVDGVLFEVQGTWVAASDGQPIPQQDQPFNLLFVPDPPAP